MLATVQSGAINGFDALPIQVEVDYNPRGMTGFTIVGLPDTAVQESRERARTAVNNSHLDFSSKRCLFFLSFRIPNRSHPNATRKLRPNSGRNNESKLSRDVGYV